MKFTVISVFLILIIPIVSAVDFSFTSPDSAKINETFNVDISSAAAEQYDIKIIVQNGLGATISEIYDNGWRNPFRYILSAFPAQSSFQLRATSYSDSASVCVRLRKNGVQTYTEKCAQISLQDSVSREQESSSEEEEEARKSDSEEETEENFSSSPEFIPLSGEAVQTIEVENNPILLVPQNNKREVFVSKDEKLRIFAAYAFAFLAIAVLIFVLVRKPNNV